MSTMPKIERAYLREGPKRLRVTDHGMKVWQLMWENSEWARTYRAEVVAFAEQQGGITLAYWRLARGPFFGERTLMTISEAARELKVPTSTLQAVRSATHAHVRQRLGPMPEGEVGRAQGPSPS